MANEDQYIADYYRDQYKSDLNIFSEKPLYHGSPDERVFVSHDFDLRTDKPRSSISKINSEHWSLFCYFIALEVLMDSIGDRYKPAEPHCQLRFSYCGHGVINEDPWSVFLHRHIKRPGTDEMKFATKIFLDDMVSKGVIKDLGKLNQDILKSRQHEINIFDDVLREVLQEMS
jgi:hypothetical protein